MKEKGLVLTWGRMVRRSVSMADFLDADEVHLKPVFSSKYLKTINYILSFFRTIIYCRKGYDYLIIVMPPVFSLYAIALYKIFSKRKMKVLIDMHNGVLRREWRSWPGFNYLLSKVDVVIAHNDVVKKAIDEQFMVESFVLTDPIMRPKESTVNTAEFIKKDVINVIVPLSYADDEPIDEILGAASKLKGTVNFIFTGKPKGRFARNELSGLVTVTGYVDDEMFYKIMKDSDLVLCLTDNSDIQMCALIEALSLKKKFICSNNEVNQLYFKSYSFSMICNKSEAIYNVLNSCDVSSNGDAKYDVEESLERYKSYWEERTHGLRI